MASRWQIVLGLCGMVMVGTACADSLLMPTSATVGHVEAVCHKWTESPCLLRVAGHLRSAETGAPLAGKRLRFVSEGSSICSSTTDRSGRATCLGIVPSGRAVAESGYRIEFDGDGRLLANSANSP